MDRKVYIYGLSDNDGVIRYIGQSYRPKVRRGDHLSEAKRGVVSHKTNWIRKVLNDGGDINVTIIEECCENTWVDREKYWIGKYDNLTNKSDGGEGNSGTRYNISLNDFKLWVIRNTPLVKNESGWREYVRNNNLPNHIPSRPDSVFKNSGWGGWSDFLGNKKTYMNYDDLKIYINSIGVGNSIEYKAIRDLNSMPLNPNLFYKDDWVDWYQFLGKPRCVSETKKRKYKISSKFLTYEESKKFIKEFKFTSKVEYVAWYKKNREIGLPADPIPYYRGKGWVSWVDFFGNNIPKKINRKPNNKFMDYDNSREWVKNNLTDVNSENKWRLITKELPIFIPKRPDAVFKDKGWVSWTIFFRD